jgi:hypothetical protein
MDLNVRRPGSAQLMVPKVLRVKMAAVDVCLVG